MTTPARIKRLAGGLGAVLLLLVLGYALIRPFQLRAGATDAEVSGPMPGDIQAPGALWTRAITVDATPEQIWPWLAQFGQGRGGWYSYDWLESLLGFNIHPADRILPEYQRPAIGDPICLMPGFCSKVFIVEPGRHFGWQARLPDGAVAWTFIVGLRPIDAGHTRLVIRESIAPGVMPPPALIALELADLPMELKTLHTLKARAEGAAEPPWATALEILLWLAALIPGVAAGVLTLTRKRWGPPLSVGLDSVALLLVLTFLFLPLWLRAALDLALWAGLAWAVRGPAGAAAGRPAPSS